MKVFEINAYSFGSPGKIMLGIGEVGRKNGIEIYTASSKKLAKQTDIPFHKYIDNVLLFNVHKLLGFVSGNSMGFSYIATHRLIKELDGIKPDVIHLHNIHGWYVNVRILFEYLKKKDVRLIWTLHDCWAFTGHCPYFTVTKCEKWKTGCYDCPSFREYPRSLVDNSRRMWNLKKEWFTGVKDMVLVTPSQWLACLVKQSFLKDYPVRVINNGINLSVFRPVVSDFRKKHNIPEGKFVLLGVAFGWGSRKGLDVFIELSKRLDAERYQIVLVGTDNATDRQLPENIISIHCTQNQQELAEIYSAADLFVNPTREEVLGMVNVEALACGTPGITFRTGGSPECYDETCGAVVDCDDIDAMEREIIRICGTRPFTEEACLTRAKAFDMNDRFKEYVDLYREILR